MDGNKLYIDKDYNVKVGSLKEILRYHKDRVSLVYIAAFKSFINNFDELKAFETSEDLKDLNGKIMVSDMATLKEKMMSKEFALIRE